MQEKNYYIVIPVNATNIAAVYLFIETEHTKLCNIGNNCDTLQIIPNPSSPLFPCYRFELKESLFIAYKVQLESMGAEIYDSNLAYLEAYPPIPSAEEI